MLYLNYLLINLNIYLDKIKAEFSVLDFNPERAIGMLRHMGIGMLVIFVIIGVIILATMAIQKLFSGKKVKEDK